MGLAKVVEKGEPVGGIMGSIMTILNKNFFIRKTNLKLFSQIKNN
jgi:hypothetical protein